MDRVVEKLVPTVPTMRLDADGSRLEPLPPSMDTPLGRFVHSHINEQCSSFMSAYHRALVTRGADPMDVRLRGRKAESCVKMVWRRFEEKCGGKVMNFQKVVALRDSEHLAATEDERAEKMREAKGRLEWCARYPATLEKDEVNKTPVTWYFKPKAQ